MSLTKYAEFEVLDTTLVPKNIGASHLSRLRRQAHRHHFTYSPRPGFLYVRSRAISSRCNDNYDMFPAAEIKKAYKTFVGKPVFVNHKNADHRRARGVIIDAALHEDANPDGTPDTWVEVLMEVDAVRFPMLAKAVAKGDIARTSMGTDVAYSRCTACGNKAYTPADYCEHIPRMKGMKIHKRLASGQTQEVLIAEECYGLGFFENSLLVEPPADPTAYVLGVEDGNELAKAASRGVTAGQCVMCNPGLAATGSTVLCDSHDFQRRHDYGFPSHYNEYPNYPKVANRVRLSNHETGAAMDLDAGMSRVAALRQMVEEIHGVPGDGRQRLAYGEVKAPSKVDTMRAEACPVCGDDDAYTGERCNVCGYTQPPDQFRDPDLNKAREVDLRQEQNEQQDPLDPSATAEEAEGDLECTNCGEVFSAEGEAEAGPGDAPEEEEEEASEEPPGEPEDRDSQKADDDGDLSDLADLSDAELGLEDEEDEEEAEEADPDEDPTSTGEGRVTPEDTDEAEQNRDDADLGSLTVKSGDTCPVCGEGTLAPVASDPARDEDEPALTEVGPEARTPGKISSASR